MKRLKDLQDLQEQHREKSKMDDRRGPWIGGETKPRPHQIHNVTTPKPVHSSSEPPFTPDPPKRQQVIPGKDPAYSRVRHLARTAMKRYERPVDTTSIRESRGAEIVKEIVKKKQTKDKFQSDPIISDTIVKDQQMAGSGT